MWSSYNWSGWEQSEEEERITPLRAYGASVEMTDGRAYGVPAEIATIRNEIRADGFKPPALIFYRCEAKLERLPVLSQARLP
jgi:hypothetical protein